MADDSTVPQKGDMRRHDEMFKWALVALTITAALLCGCAPRAPQYAWGGSRVYEDHGLTYPTGNIALGDAVCHPIALDGDGMPVNVSFSVAFRLKKSAQDQHSLLRQYHACVALKKWGRRAMIQGNPEAEKLCRHFHAGDVVSIGSDIVNPPPNSNPNDLVGCDKGEFRSIGGGRWLKILDHGV